MKEESLSALLEQLAAAPERDPSAVQGRLRPGLRIGRFELLRELGRGGFGVVFEARDTELGRHVAVKTARLQSGAAASAARLQRLRHEAEAAARLQHPNVVTLHDFGVHEGAPYLVLE